MNDAFTFRTIVRLGVVAAVITIGTVFIGIEVFRLLPSVLIAAFFLTIASQARRRLTDSDVLTRVVVVVIGLACYMLALSMMIPVVVRLVEIATGSVAMTESLFEGMVVIAFFVFPVITAQHLFREGWKGRQEERARIVLAAVKLVAVGPDVDFDVLPYDHVSLSDDQRRTLKRRMIVCIAVACGQSFGALYVLGTIAGNPFVPDVSIPGFVIGASVWLIAVMCAVWLAGHAFALYRVVWLQEGARSLYRYEVELLNRSHL